VEVEQVVFLSQRFARKRGHRVVSKPVEGEARTVVHPLHLHMALFAAMECCLEELPDGAAVTLSVGRGARGPTVEFRGATEDGAVAAGPSESSRWEGLRKWTESLGAGLERLEAGFGILILFRAETGPQGPSSQPEG